MRHSCSITDLDYIRDQVGQRFVLLNLLFIVLDGLILSLQFVIESPQLRLHYANLTKLSINIKLNKLTFS